ncbi:hypothetical protein FBU30_006449 [Linnemannia zychae]|nr:hypothetical protein FBU30_006449 [Linnemannia zychae]
MANSRDSHLSDELENINLPQEPTSDSNSGEQSFSSNRLPPNSQQDSRRVSINSLGSNASSSTVKYNNSNSHNTNGNTGQQNDSASLNSGQRTPTQQGGQPSSFSGTLKRPRLSIRHSTNLLNADTFGSGSRRRRSSQGKRPGSSRSSIHQRNRSSDEDDEDYDSQQEDDDNRSSHSRARRMSRRSTRNLAAEDYDDHRSGYDRDQHENQSGEEDEDEGSEVEPLTLKDRQETLNQTHPFGLPLWKPALYKKSRSVIRKANSALHSQPSADLYLSVGNVLWTLVFGWWLALVCFIIGITLYLVPFGGSAYGRVVLGLSYYLVWPFGQYVERELPPGGHRASRLYNASTSNNDGYEGDESRPLLSRSNSILEREPKAPLYRKAWTFIRNLPSNIYRLRLGGVVYYIFYYLLIGPLHIFVSCLCWFMVVSIPMGKFTYVLATHLQKDPLRLHFKRGSSLSLSPQRSEILLCTYDAIGFQYYKYTYDGTNIIFINLMPVVLFTILDEYVLTRVLGHDSLITSPEVIFSLGLASVIPLSYFIGMAVSSISAQSSLGMGAVINATFGSIIEIILYSVALTQGKGLITEGALIGSFLAGILLMPGMSMMSGAVKKKEQKFNAKSAGVTATMLIMALIGVLTPTLFYSIYGRFELRCTPCPETAPLPMEATCQRCYHHQPNPADDIFFQKNVKPLMYFCCIILPSAYLIGIWFSLRTHVKQIWHEPQSAAIRDSSIYRKLLPTHIVQQLLHLGSGTHAATAPHRVDAEMGRSASTDYQATSSQGSLNERRPPHSAPEASSSGAVPTPALHAAHGLLSSLSMDQAALKHEHDDEGDEAHGGHDSPNWSKAKSATVLLACTVLYSIIAEILVDSVDAVSSIDEKLLGLTLFALVPNVTEFMNAISFAMYGNIALSMEIGSAYALQLPV